MNVATSNANMSSGAMATVIAITTVSTPITGTAGTTATILAEGIGRDITAQVTVRAMVTAMAASDVAGQRRPWLGTADTTAVTKSRRVLRRPSTSRKSKR